jgi:hypothetical protein
MELESFVGKLLRLFSDGGNLFRLSLLVVKAIDNKIHEFIFMGLKLRAKAVKSFRLRIL